MGGTVLILRVLLIQFNVIHFQYTIRMWIKPYLMDSPSDKVLQLRLVLHSDSPETSKAGWMMSDGCKGCCCCTSLACAYVASSSSSVVVVAIKGNWTWRDRHFWADSVGEAPRGHSATVPAGSSSWQHVPVIGYWVEITIIQLWRHTTRREQRR